MLKAGIIGLPNVGKSSLFNTLTNSNALSANYPFATIEPNVGVVYLKDERLDYLKNLYNPKSVVPTSFEFIDIAGLVKGASKGEGLGNQFLAQIREVDAICEVIRVFEDDNITHLNGKVDPISDMQTIKLELGFSDLEIIEKRLPKLEKKAKAGDEESKKEAMLLEVIKDAILNEKNIKIEDFKKEDRKIIKGYNFLILKPIIYLLNLSEMQIENYENNDKVKELIKIIKDEKNDYVAICVKLEQDLLKLSDSEKDEFKSLYNIKDSALNILIKKTYDLLGLETFFTSGKDECRAWTYKKGMLAPDCAGIIHTDFKKGFIMAEVLSYDDLIKFSNYENAKLNGKVRLEGKNYQVCDGDIILFRFNV